MSFVKLDKIQIFSLRIQQILTESNIMKLLLASALIIFFNINSLATPISIPNASFETELVNRGYDTDGLVNGQMDDSDILGITILSLLNSPSMSGPLDLSAFTNLSNLTISKAVITSLDITAVPNLKQLDLIDLANLTSIDLSNNTALEGYYFNNTVLHTIDLKNHPNVLFGQIYNNSVLSIIKLNSASGPYNASIGLNNNPLLTCIEVDDLAVAQNKLSTGNWLGFSGVTLTLSCLSAIPAVVMLPTSITLPQLLNSDISAISNPQPGMMTWSLDDSCVKVYNGTSWNCL